MTAWSKWLFEAFDPDFVRRTGIEVREEWSDQSKFRWHDSGKALRDRTLGRLGEIAVERVYRELNPERIVGRDGGIDGFFVVDGIRVPYQVKTRYRQPNVPDDELDLFFDRRSGADSLSQFKAAVAIMVIEYGKDEFSHGDQVVAVVGWIMKRDFGRLMRVANYGYGDRVAVRQSELIPAVMLQDALLSLTVQEIGLVRAGRFAYKQQDDDAGGRSNGSIAETTT